MTLHEYVAERLARADFYDGCALAAGRVGELLPAGATGFRWRMRAVSFRDQAAACREEAAFHAVMLQGSKWWEG